MGYGIKAHCGCLLVSLLAGFLDIRTSIMFIFSSFHSDYYFAF